MAAGEFPAVTDRVTQDNIDAYAEISGDFNPLHVDPAGQRRAAARLRGEGHLPRADAAR
jgi:acyl dehydratase